MKWEKGNQFWYFHGLHCLYNVKIVITGRKLLHFYLPLHSSLEFSYNGVKNLAHWQCLLFSSLCKNFDNFDISSQHWLEFSARGSGGRQPVPVQCFDKQDLAPATDWIKDKFLHSQPPSSALLFLKTKPRRGCKGKLWVIAVAGIVSSLWEVCSIRLDPWLAQGKISEYHSD